MKDTGQYLVDNYPRFMALALKLLGNSEDAKDIVQDSVLACLERNNIVGDPTSYCLSTVWNRCHSLLRTKHYEPLPEPEKMPWLTTDPYEQETVQEIRYVLDQLSPELQQILKLKYIEKLSGESIAKTCHIHRTTLYRHLEKAKRKFKTKFQELTIS